MHVTVSAMPSQRAVVSACYCYSMSLLQHTAVCTRDSHVTWLVHEPESLPFVDDCSEIFRCVQQLLHASLRSRRVDRQEAADGCRQTDGEKGELHETSHQAFLRERFAVV